MYQFKTDPFEHQRLAIRSAWKRPGYAYLMEMGTGKSKVIVDEVCALREAGLVDRVIIFAPKGTYGNWVRKEIPAHMPDRHLSTSRVHLWSGGSSAREKLALAALERDDKMPILVVNTEAMSQSPRAVAAVEKFLMRGRIYAAVDEASTIKNPNAARTKTLIRLARSPCIHFRRVATGSPVPRGPLDLWAQFEFLSPGMLGFRSYRAFMSNYAVVERKEFSGAATVNEQTGEIESRKHQVDVVVAYKNIDDLSRRVAQHAYVARKEDCLTLPPKLYAERDVELTPEQARMYQEMRDIAVTEITEGRWASVQVVIAQLMKLHQIVCGHITDEEGRLVELPTRKIDALQEILQEADDKAIVWCHYRNDVERVAAELRRTGHRVVEYHGGTSAEDRSRAIEEFQEGDAGVFLGTPHAGGYGITLTAARSVVYYSCGYDLEKRSQSEDRAHRIGQTRSVTYTDLVARGTVEERILDALRKKKHLSDIIMAGPQSARDLFS